MFIYYTHVLDIIVQIAWREHYLFFERVVVVAYTLVSETK